MKHSDFSHLMHPVIGRILVLIFLPALLVAQQDVQTSWKQKLDQYKLKTSIGVQLWTTYTINETVFDTSSGTYQPVDNRLNMQIRRTRISVSGQPYENLQFKLAAALDLVGRDILAGTESGANNGASPQFRLWDSYIQWRALPGREYLNVIVGYMPPQIGRESITSSLRSTSFEKSISQFYLRRHLTGTNPGRAMGINIGGLLYQPEHQLNFGYDAGIFTPVFGSLGGNSTGHFFAPMLTGRFAAYFGDPEFTQYTISHKVNYLGKRNGLSVALAGAYQGKTDLYTTNTALGADFLFNWHALTVDGDWTFLWRQKEIGTGESRISAMAQTGYVRFGYNLSVKHDYVLEPLFMYTLYVGESDAEGQHDAALLKTSSGTDQAIDIGVNFYFNPDLRLSLHYTMRDGDPGDAGDGAEINNYFTQSGVGAIHRGDWLGLGVVAIF